ncbi:glycosyltransferase [Anaerolineales bacterium]
MRVVHIIKAKQIAGAETHLLTLLPLLQQHAFEIHLLLLVEAAYPMQDLIQQMQAQGIAVQSIPIVADLDPRSFLKLYRAIKALQPDLVHTHLIHADTHGIPAAKWAGVKTIVSSRHAADLFRRRQPLKSLNRLVMRLTRKTIAISDSIKHIMITYDGLPPEKIQRIHYGLAHQPISEVTIQAQRQQLRADLNLAPNTFIMGMVCRLIEEKAIPYVLEALALLADQDAQLIIFGDGPLRDSLHAQSRVLGLAERVSWLGWRDDARQIMAGFDLFLMPSLSEGFGMALLEAMACRLPIIASNVASLPEIVADQVSGLLVPPADVPAIAAALDQLIQDPERLKSLGKAGEKRLESHFTADRMAQETADCYRSISQRENPTS